MLTTPEATAMFNEEKEEIELNKYSKKNYGEVRDICDSILGMISHGDLS